MLAVADDRVTDTGVGGANTVIVAAADFVGAVAEVAAITTVPGNGTVVGAV